MVASQPALNNIKFSIIVPVFNRPDEIRELLESLTLQEYPHFEVIIVEDGSTLKCNAIAEDFASKLVIKYFFKPNTGPGDSRNFGAQHATGDYLVFFDSDCIIPSHYLKTVTPHLVSHQLDVYGGPDKNPSDLGNLQLAINYSMTSFLTTGGIRGHRRTARSFQPRSFNMGIKSEVFRNSGGFSDMHPGEDPELIYRLMKMNHTKGLINDAFVYHRRRINLKQFSKQVYKFGVARAILMKRFPASRKWIFAMPSLATAMGTGLLAAGIVYPIIWYLLCLGMSMIFIDALIKTKTPVAALLAIPATSVQVAFYGWGFFKGWWNLMVLKRQEQVRFPGMFMGSAT